MSLHSQLGKLRASALTALYRRPVGLGSLGPIVTFTFDDFPQTALYTGGAILSRYGARGTYYVALGLMGKGSPSGPVCVHEDLAVLLKQHHELGCHTYAHCHSWDTATADFERSIIDNREALKAMFPGERFKSLSYPISEPRPSTKRDAARHFLCMRAGGQTLNAGVTDLNQLSSYFLEQSGGRMEPVRSLIDRNREQKGWLIFSTHDVCENPSRFGCTPEFLEQVVEYVVQSGARILPVGEALESLMLAQPRASKPAA